MKSRKIRLVTGLCVALIMAGCGKTSPTTVEDLDNMSGEEMEAALGQVNEEPAEEEETEAEEAEEAQEFVFPEAMPEILDARLEDGLVQVNDALLYCNCSFDIYKIERMGQYVTGTFQEEYEQVLSWGMLPVFENKPNLNMPVSSGKIGGIEFGDPENLHTGAELMFLHYYNDTDETLKLGECKAVLLPKLSDIGEHAQNVFEKASYFAHGINCVDGEWNYTNVKELFDAQGYEYEEVQHDQETCIMIGFTNDFSRYSDNDETLYYRFTFDANTTQLTSMSAMFH